jgi:hypothetical protein
VHDLAEEVDKEIIVYNQSEIDHVKMMKLKRIQNLEMQKSGRKIKSPVASKKKPSKWCMCMRGKAPVANKESEEGSEDDPLQNSFYN